MTMHNERLNRFVDPEGHNFATGNECHLVIELTKKDLKKQNAPTTLELLQMEGKRKNSRNKKTSRDNESKWARHSGDQAI